MYGIGKKNIVEHEHRLGLDSAPGSYMHVFDGFIITYESSPDDFLLDNEVELVLPCR